MARPAILISICCISCPRKSTFEAMRIDRAFTLVNRSSTRDRPVAELTAD
jgi:hypothetical protein